MLLPLFFLFTVVPFVELYLLFQVGDAMGWANTLLLVLVTGIVGAHMARSQGRQIMIQVQSEMAQGGLPADGMLNGFLVFIGGVLLITPGIITDVIGFCFIFPVTRWGLVKALKAHIAHGIKSGKYRFQGANMGGGPTGSGGFHVYTSQRTSQHWPQSESVRDVIEVSAEEIESSDSRG